MASHHTPKPSSTDVVPLRQSPHGLARLLTPQQVTEVLKVSRGLVSVLTSADEVRPGPQPMARLLTPQQVAEALQVSRGLVSVLTKRGDLPAVYIGRLPRYRAEAIAAFIARREQEGGSP